MSEYNAERMKGEKFQWVNGPEFCQAEVLKLGFISQLPVECLNTHSQAPDY